MRRFPLLFLLLALLALTAASVHALPADIAEDGAVAGQDAQQPEELFLSEYIEGSSLHKGLEVYKGTGSAVDLAAGDYVLEFYFNGSTSVGGTIPLSGVVAAGEVWVVADDGADPAILAETDQTSTISFFNGDDVIILRKDGAIIDAFGQLGVDPGNEWGTGDQSAADNTLRRMAGVCAGDTNPDDAFDP